MAEVAAERERASGVCLFGVKYFCRSTSTILAGSDGCSFDDAPFGSRARGFRREGLVVATRAREKMCAVGTEAAASMAPHALHNGSID